MISVNAETGFRSLQKIMRDLTTLRKRFYVLFFCLGILAAILAAVHVAQAALGESADSVMSDLNALSAMQGAAIIHTGYTVQEITSASVTVREYISPSGVVFGIAWNGLIHPDLTPLLGSYAGEYHQALLKSPRKPGSRFSRVKTDVIVVEKWGHMRNLRGRAYVLALIPPGVIVDEIK